MRLLGAVLLAISLTLGVGAVAPAGAQVVAADPDWVFYSKDKTRYNSPWYRGAHRIMIHFGCTRAPYYSPDPRCTRNRGFHHGLDLAMPCGTMLKARTRAWVVRTDGLGPAYGPRPVRLRNYDHGWDVVIGHTRRVFVRPGDRLHRGDRIARASDAGAPDGCHLHFEKRAIGGGLSTAVKPRQLIHLRPRKK
ncbi:M23 family metallopeptidase [Nocardioides coralli]|uniref:M23 family metallopeptidase n=1 Tax=Nocardioides coralli TaxID=2872154 RepID=UPI001CA42CA4|nr:M23 family metallopeptidase [Nocardioides coralli]QZY28198.1 M23 family metallopeptidase [Nocardioides coralli]